MTARPVAELSPAERFNFLLTNRLPRRLLTDLMGRFSRVESRWLTAVTVRVWQWFVDDLRLDEAQPEAYRSLHACFTRSLKPGSRPVDADPDVLVSPCDAIVGAHGRIDGTRVFQVKGYPYDLAELVPDEQLLGRVANGSFVTLRLKSSMYHRFHAPAEGDVRRVTYISGDMWNVNPPALKCVEKLYCRNERAVIEYALADDLLVLVPVAAILVASIRLHCLPASLNMHYDGRQDIDCHSSYRKGDELGYFEHGSTIIVLAPPGYTLCNNVSENQRINMGESLLRRIHE